MADDAPAVLRSVLAGLPRYSPLQDLAMLPESSRLVELSVGDEPLAVGLRARFGAFVAAALVEAWAERALSPSERAALRQLADPFVLTMAARTLQRRGALVEVLSIFRPGLPTPSVLLELLAKGEAERRALMVALAEDRRDVNTYEGLARGICDPEMSVRLAAGAALFRSVGDRIAYDPAWPEDRRRQVAQAVQELKQRHP